jgi:hypothetical protein
MDTDFPRWWHKGAQTHISSPSTKSLAIIAKEPGCPDMLFPSPHLIGDNSMSPPQCAFALNTLWGGEIVTDQDLCPLRPRRNLFGATPALPGQSRH